MANLVKRYADPAPAEPPGHAEFERFIRDLDAGWLGPDRAEPADQPANRRLSPWPNCHAARSSG